MSWKCIECQQPTTVCDTRPSVSADGEMYVRRRFKCPGGHRFTSIEILAGGQKPSRLAFDSAKRHLSKLAATDLATRMRAMADELEAE